MSRMQFLARIQMQRSYLLFAAKYRQLKPSVPELMLQQDVAQASPDKGFTPWSICLTKQTPHFKLYH